MHCIAAVQQTENELVNNLNLKKSIKYLQLNCSWSKI